MFVRSRFFLVIPTIRAGFERFTSTKKAILQFDCTRLVKLTKIIQLASQFKSSFPPLYERDSII